MNNLTDYIEHLKHLKSLNRATINIDEVINSLNKVKPLTSEIKEVERPIVAHNYTQGEWMVTRGGDLETSIGCGKLRIAGIKHYQDTLYLNDPSIKEGKANARLITQAPKMHILCEAMFDMLVNKPTKSLYLPILEEVLNEINPKP